VTVNVAALIPAYNEAATIADVVRGVRPFVSQVLVVDDGSGDSTAGEARAAGAGVVRHAANLGKGHAVRTGLAHLLSGNVTHVLLLDGDMQHLPHEAPRLVDAARATGADVVIG
jgi:glycosyltransferase involved in cell wall biosynthesis